MQCINDKFLEEVFVMENEKKDVLEFESVQELKEYLNNCDEDTLISIVLVKESDHEGV